ncbi:MAG: segregation/condensation protein A [Candidatus Azambacteria bacterium]|nr:segregation/condensation protein A [Candidatus Azambacteria bacterium]
MEYKVSLEKFTGPLDLLVSLIEEKKMAIGEISLAQVTDQFLEYLNKLQTSDVNNSMISGVNTSEYQRIVADFLVVASRLILIKSRSLLPNLVLKVEEEDDIKDLENRLKAYQEIKTMAKMLGKWAKDRNSYFSREYFLNITNIYGEPSRTTFYPPKNIASEDLKNIYELFLKTLPQIEKLEEKGLIRIMSLEEKIEELMGRVSMAAEASFNEISGSSTKVEKVNVVLAFLAILMLFRKRILEISQDKLFGDITVKRINNL